jgi:hypothetical protein
VPSEYVLLQVVKKRVSYKVIKKRVNRKESKIGKGTIQPWKG